MKMKMVLFDIDGTLLYTGGSGRIAFERVFEDLYGISGAWKGLIPDGKTDPVIVRELAAGALQRDLEPEEYERIYRKYIEYFRVEIQNPPKFILYPGVLQLLNELSKRSEVVMGIVTGNYEEPAWLKLERGGIRHHFKFGGFASDASCRRELTRIGFERGQKLCGRVFSNEDVFVIGDTPHDVDAGKNLGAHTIAVTTGSTDYESFRRLEPSAILNDLSDTQSFLKILDL